MNVKLHTLKLYCRKSEEIIDFSPQVSFFHGKISAGKSSLVKLIDFCFGGDLERTPALISELISVQLSADVGQYEVMFEREVGSHQVIASWVNKDGEVFRVLVPIVATSNSSPVVGDDIFNLSDLLFYLLGVKPLKVRRSKVEQESPLIRLSIRDVLWYCYLQQDHLDSSFFRLEDTFKRLKSRDVMRFTMGYYTERLNDLEIELDELRRDRSAKLEGAKQLRQFLLQFGYGTEEHVVKQISHITEQLNSVMEELAQFRAGVRAETHFADQLRSSCVQLSDELFRMEQALSDVSERINDQESLRAELLANKFKIARVANASSILGGVAFVSCPCCGEKLMTQHQDALACNLCGSPQGENTVDGPSLDAMRRDLDSRIVEISESIERHKRAREVHLRKLAELRIRKQSAEKQLEEALRDYDSVHMGRGIELEKRRSTLEEKLRALDRVLEMPKAVAQLEEAADTIKAMEERVRREIDSERGTLSSATQNIELLERTYLELLLEVGVPGVSSQDVVSINKTTWLPSILPEADRALAWDFFNAGSGGKKTLLNVCYALAVHVVANNKGLPLPSLLMIDTPMKNIGEDVNEDIFRAFYQCLYRLASGPLRSTQFIIIDKEFIGPEDEPVQVVDRYMTPDNPMSPPLISYYRGA